MKVNPNNKGFVVEIRFVGNDDGTFNGENFNIYIPAHPQHGITASKTYWCKALNQVPTKLKQALAAKHVQFDPMLSWESHDWQQTPTEDDAN